MAQRVLLTDNISQDALDVFSDYPGIEAVRIGTPEKSELIEMLPEYDAVIVRSPTKLTSDVISAGTRLKFIGRAGVGVDNIDVAAATERGIIVMNAPGGNTISTAEHTCAMIMALARRIPQADVSVRGQKWERSALKGVELYGKTLGIIGLGRVGREVAERMRAFSMEVIASDPYVTEDDAASVGATLVAMEAVLENGHFITIHVPLGSDTRGIISGPEIERMRDGVFLINCARGGVIDETALDDAINKGKVAGVALDVFEAEPPGKNPLLASERSVFTPHLGAATAEAQIRVAVDISKTIAEALANGSIRDAINPPAT